MKFKLLNMSLESSQKKVENSRARNIGLSVLCYTIRFHLNPTKNVWGVELANGSWSGMIGRVASGDFDVCIAGMATTPERFDHLGTGLLKLGE